MIEEVFQDLEQTLRSFTYRRPLIRGPFLHGFTITFSQDGRPIIRKLGSGELVREGYREPLYEELIDDERGELKLIVELPGVDKDKITVEAGERLVELKAEGEGRRYRLKAELSRRVAPESAKARFQNGLLEVVFQLREKANKGLSRIKVE